MWSRIQPLPEVRYNYFTGYNSVLKPILKFHKPEEVDVPEGTSVLQVIDCVGHVGNSVRTKVNETQSYQKIKNNGGGIIFLYVKRTTPKCSLLFVLFFHLILLRDTLLDCNRVEN